MLVGIGYRSDPGLGLTIVVGDGVVTAEDWRAYVGRLTSDPEWPFGRLGLVDLSCADTSALRGDVVREMAATFGCRGSDGLRWKCAIVAGDLAPRSAVTFQQAMGPTGLVIMIFSNIETACEWLEITAEDVAAVVEDLRREIQRR